MNIWKTTEETNIIEVSSKGDASVIPIIIETCFSEVEVEVEVKPSIFYCDKKGDIKEEKAVVENKKILREVFPKLTRTIPT